MVVHQSQNVTMTIEVEADSAMGIDHDVWIIARNAGGLFLSLGVDSRWHLGLGYAFYTGPLVDISWTPFDAPLPLGSYKAWLGLDTQANGVLNIPSVSVFDVVDFQVVP